MERRKEEERERKRKMEKERLERVRAYAEPEWAKVEEQERDDWDEKEEKAVEKEELYCVACGEKFKSEKQWENHEQSKKHREKQVRSKKNGSEGTKSDVTKTKNGSEGTKSDVTKTKKGSEGTKSDVTKTRLQAQGSSTRYNGWLDAMRKIWTSEGVKGMFRGIIPRITWYIPASVLNMVVEFLRDHFNTEPGNGNMQDSTSLSIVKPES
ncbi:Mitochondrial substrate/solute carrier - like 10 [Theobroma cacao]|nr:Mitochondrial substrate/solute carrier - like 10 [Theobroma cacao]